jgi:hypothetical protein
MLSKFTKDELEGKTIPTQEEFDKFFEESIFPLIDYSKTKFLNRIGNVSKTPTSRIELRNSDNVWLFDYDYNKKTQHFYYCYNTVLIMCITYFSLLNENMALNMVQKVNYIMRNKIEKHFNLIGVMPTCRNW